MTKYLLIFLVILTAVNFSQNSSTLITVKENAGKIFPIDGTHILEEKNDEVREYFRKNPDALSQKRLKKAAWSFTVGSQRNWYTYNFVTETRYSSSYTCRAVGEYCYIFVEDSLWNIRVDQQVIDSVLTAFDQKTPANPEKGVFETTVAAFGNPPDIDVDPKIIILIQNIKDGFSGSGGFIAGYFDSYNETLLLQSNRAEIYYVDANPLDLQTASGLRTGMSTTAHEFQHMINFNYHKFDPQLTFINEGCSMLAELFCGYPATDHSLYGNETNYYLFGWRREDRTKVLNDYSRAQRFLLYFWDHFGMDIFRHITSGTGSGIDILNDALQKDGQSLTFNEVFVNWLIANSLDDKSVNQYYGYYYPDLIKSHSQVYYDPNASGSSTLFKLAADYITFTEGTNLKITFSSGSSSIKVKAIELGTNIKNVVDVPLNSEFSLPEFGTDYSTVTFAVINSDPTSNLEYSFNSSGNALTTVKELKWDETEPTGYYALTPGDTICVTFDAVKGGKLDSVKVALRRAGSITGGVWEYNGSTYPTPFGKELLFPITATINTTTKSPYPVPYENWSTINLSSLNISTDKPFAVGFIVGPDPNSPGVMFTEMASLTPYHSFTYLHDSEQGPGWYYLVTNKEADSISIYLIRAYISFTTSAGEEVVEILPKNYSLSQNYPNPFNPVTKIRYSIPIVETHRDASLPVTLKVYDILGNEVATLVNEEKPAGNYNVTFNASGLASGIYYYRIKAGNFVQTKKMILLK